MLILRQTNVTYVSGLHWGHSISAANILSFLFELIALMCCD